MNADYIRMLLLIAGEANLESLEVNRWFSSVKILKSRRNPQRTIERKVQAPIFIPEPMPVLQGPVCYEVKSPEVGTFYWNQDKSRRRFLRKKHPVKEGDVLGYLEFLGHRKEITSPCDGKIVRVYARHGRRFDYGAPLFGIEAKN
jgi:biotin carboxyl carrier protein